MNKKMKSILATGLSLIMTLGLVGCSSSRNDDIQDAENKEKYEIGIVLGEGGAIRRIRQS